MKISSNYSRNITFGYDKELNKELKVELAQHQDRTWARNISSLNSYCNGLEANLVRYEKSQKDASSKYHDYLDVFLTAKQMLAGLIEITFDKLHFADREYKHYDDEFIKNGSREKDWRKDARETLVDWVSDEVKGSAPVETKKEPTIKPKEQISSNIEETENSDSSVVNSVMSMLATKSFLEEFKPDESSPKGFSSVAGMTDLKRDLEEGIIQFVQNPEQSKLDFEEYGKTIPKGLLLYGPPGCGKTYITQALASEIQFPMYMLNISKMGSHYINMTSKNLKSAFDEAIKIAEKTDRPCILFMDEIDSIGFDRNSRMEPDDLKQVATMLQAMDAAKNSNVIIIGATNKFNLLDPAIRRRFDNRVFVDVPDNESIKSLLEKTLYPMRKAEALLSSPDDIDAIAKKLNGYSNDSICKITRSAALNAMRRNRADISVEDFSKAIETTTEEKPDRKMYMADSKTKPNKMGFVID